MSKIKYLNENIIPKIAAGEVIEGPSSIVKELVENALDSNALEIIIEVYNGGLDKIRVVDNGCGMDLDDLLMCYKPFSTSKIFSLEDIDHIKTLGFRGEALSSIYSVSNLLIKSKTSNSDFGNEIYFSSNEEKVNQVGMKDGTIIEVTGIFDKVPARKKFLKSSSYEYQKILDVLTGLVLANYNVGFKFSHNGKLIFKTSGLHKSSKTSKLSNLPKSFNSSGIFVEDYLNRIELLLGKDFKLGAIRFSEEETYMKLSGYIFHPKLFSKSPKNQFIFVNGRNVNCSIVTKAIRDSLGKLIRDKEYPCYILNIDLDPSLVDVNMHPRKEEVSFWNNDTVYSFIKKSTESVISHHNLIYVKDESWEYDFGASDHQFLKLKDSSLSWNIEDIKEPILQVNKTYLLASVEGGVLIIDQHAAHESILFDEYLKRYKEELNKKESYVLDLPYEISLSLVDYEIFKDKKLDLESLGFKTEELNNTCIKIISVPMILKDHEFDKFLLEFLHEDNFDIDDKSMRTIAFLSCRSAVKAGDVLSLEERRNLVEKMLTTNSYYTCPHGRPAKVFIPNKYLESLFLRGK